jgi:OFA family oxalate/formate antiporter-like MFS transporter
VPIRNAIGSFGYENAFLWFGLGQGIIILALSQFLRAPTATQAKLATPGRVAQTLRNYSLGEMLRQPLFWVMYSMFVLVAAGGLIATAQLASIAKDFGVAEAPVYLMGFAFATLALTVERLGVQDAGRVAAQSMDVLQGYVRDADLFRDHAGAGLL